MWPYTYNFQYDREGTLSDAVNKSDRSSGFLSFF